MPIARGAVFPPSTVGFGASKFMMFQACSPIFGLGLYCTLNLRWTPHPVVVTIRDNKDHIRVLLYSYYTTITGWGVLLT